MKVLLTLLTITLVFSMTFQKWNPSPSLRLLLSSYKVVKSGTPAARRLFNDALDKELMLQKGLKIRSLGLQMRRLQAVEKTQKVKPSESTTPMAKSETVSKALDAWLDATVLLLEEGSKRHEAQAKKWEAHRSQIQKAQIAFDDEDQGADMCTRIKSARKAGKGQKGSGKNGKSEAKAHFKELKGNAKSAWKTLRKAVKAEMSTAPKRRNQAVVPEGGEVLVEGGDNEAPGCAEAAVKCGGEDKELCDAFSNFLHSMNCFNDAKEKMRDGADMKYQCKGQCLNTLEGTLKPEGKLSATASFADLIATRKACHKQCKDGAMKVKENTKAPFKVAKDALKKAKSELGAMMKSTCMKSKGNKGGDMNKPPRKMFAKPF